MKELKSFIFKDCGRSDKKRGKCEGFPELEIEFSHGKPPRLYDVDTDGEIMKKTATDLSRISADELRSLLVSKGLTAVAAAANSDDSDGEKENGGSGKKKEKQMPGISKTAMKNIWNNLERARDNGELEADSEQMANELQKQARAESFKSKIKRSKKTFENMKAKYSDGTLFRKPELKSKAKKEIVDEMRHAKAAHDLAKGKGNAEDTGSSLKRDSPKTDSRSPVERGSEEQSSDGSHQTSEKRPAKKRRFGSSSFGSRFKDKPQKKSRKAAMGNTDFMKKVKSMVNRKQAEKDKEKARKSEAQSQSQATDTGNDEAAHTEL